MGVRNLDKIFKPRSVAVVGASEQRPKVGWTVLRNLVAGGFPGPIHPINPKHATIQSLRAYATVTEAPGPIDLAILCTPAATVPGLVRECGEAGIPGLIILTAGFRETGAAGRVLEDQLKAEWKKYAGMRIIGPNCLGVIAPHSRLNASFAATNAVPGGLALASQSGALCTSLLDWAGNENVGFSFFVSTGNMLDVGFGDLIDYFAEDADTRAAILYIESITEARGFISAARAFSRAKPIVAYKAGRFAESAHAAASHTGAMAGEDAVCDAAFRRAGVERVSEMGEMFDCAELLARRRRPRKGALAIITNAGGPGVMATDALIAQGGGLAELQPATIERLNGALPSFWSRGNPVDVLGDADAGRFGLALGIVLEDPGVDSALVILTPQAMTDPLATAVEVAAQRRASLKPVLASWIGGPGVAAGALTLRSEGVPVYPTPESAVKAFMHIVSHERNLESLNETPRDIPAFALDPRKVRSQFERLFKDAGAVLSEPDSKALLEAYGIPVVRTLSAGSADEACACAERLGYPVAMKILAREITHKSDVGGVALDIRGEPGLRTAYDAMMAAVALKAPEAKPLGVTIQKMVGREGGIELIAGMKKDATFGAVLMVGAGGVAAELFRDRAIALPPLNERLARRMLESLKSWPILTGWRGKPAVNIDRLVEILIRLSYLVAHTPEIRELDVNPLLASPDDVIALDARIVVDRPFDEQEIRRFAHLAIRPYPEEFVRNDRLRSGAEVTLRPIRPEDEPLWLEFIASCSAESLHARFRYAFSPPDHRMAARFCYLDYDRELAIIAESTEAGRRRFIGVGRLAADLDHGSAEFAVLVVDRRQNEGLGFLLTRYCLEVAREWGVKRVMAETHFENARMVGIFNRLGFQLETDIQEGLVRAEKSLDAD